MGLQQVSPVYKYIFHYIYHKSETSETHIRIFNYHVIFNVILIIIEILNYANMYI